MTKKKAGWTSQYGFEAIKNKEGRRIIAGYGSYIMIDSDDELITQKALEQGLAKFMANEERRNIMSSHENVQIGKVLVDFGTHKTHVDDIGLYIVGEIYDDLKTTEDVWQSILDGDSNAFSISFEPLETAEHLVDGVWVEVGLLNLVEVSVCENPKNPLSRFEILSKSKNVKKIKKGEIMTEEELKLKDQKEDKQLSPEEKDEVVDSIEKELNKLKLLGEEIKAEDLSSLAKLVTNLRTGGEKSYPFPEKASKSEGERWPTVIANAIDDIYTKLSEMKSSEKTVKELKATVIKKSADAEDATKKADDATKKADESDKKAGDAKKNADEVKDTATKDRELLGTVQESLKNINDAVGKIDERLQKLEDQKEVKTKVSKEDLIKEYKSPNVREKADGVEIMMGEN